METVNAPWMQLIAPAHRLTTRDACCDGIADDHGCTEQNPLFTGRGSTDFPKGAWDFRIPLPTGYASGAVAAASRYSYSPDGLIWLFVNQRGQSSALTSNGFPGSLFIGLFDQVFGTFASASGSGSLMNLSFFLSEATLGGPAAWSGRSVLGAFAERPVGLPFSVPINDLRGKDVGDRAPFEHGEVFVDKFPRDPGPTTSTPEPATLALTATGLLSLTGYIKRRRRRESSV